MVLLQSVFIKSKVHTKEIENVEIKKNKVKKCIDLMNRIRKKELMIFLFILTSKKKSANK